MSHRSDRAPSRVAAAALPWLIALAGFVFDLAAFWPGQMSFDSAYAWWQARGGTMIDVVPPMFVLAWRAAEAIHSGPGLLFALHLALFWSGLALLVHALRFGPFAALATMALVAFAPVPWLLRGHVWTDVGLFSALVFATGALAQAHACGRRSVLLLALPALVYAAGLRHNAWPALAPFAIAFAWISMQRANDTHTRPWSALLSRSALLFGAVFAIAFLIGRAAQRHVPVWPSLAQFDLAAVSIATERMLLPGFMIGPGLDVDELRAAFRPWSNIPMLQGTRHGMRDPFMTDFTPEERAVLRTAWWKAISSEPGAWLAHRWRLTQALFGTHAGDWPRELVYVDAETAYRDNPPVPANASALHRALMRAAGTLRATPWLAAWPWLLAGLPAAMLAWRQRRTAAGSTAWLLLASAWLYALPLTALAPAAELRYLGWPCVASLLALCCAIRASRATVEAYSDPLRNGSEHP